ncbi:MAG: metallophosphoesterase [Planctomycetes bacterium]|nr:metallophosphoesterase [Planctomycetota bacterium]
MSCVQRFPWLLLVCAACLTQEAQGEDREVHTDRQGARPLELPDEAGAFSFIVFGDRTGGPASSIDVLAQAVEEANLLAPDLVMTVGDLVQGYNARKEWQAQMKEYRGVMSRLAMPWFPVPGNHDIYWRGEGRPPEEHEGDFEANFAPLWYAFEHKGCWFVVLYSDEGDPETGERNFELPRCQRMSPRQYHWLESVLARAAGARHVFLFLHHPRWIEDRYGDDWERVHLLLARAGNVRAVFAGHIHYLRYEGVRDGVEYHALATTGGVLTAGLERAGHVHEFHVVTVRDAGISVAALPVGAVFDPRLYTAEVSEGASTVQRELRAEVDRPLVLGPEGDVDQVVKVTVRNPGERPIDVTLLPSAEDRRWSFWPDHDHRRLAPGQEYTRHFQVRRPPAPFDQCFDLPQILLDCDFLAEALRVPLARKCFPLPCGPPPLPAVAPARHDLALALDGAGACLRLESALLDLPDGAFTVEAWARGDDFAGRRALVNKTESSEFGLFTSDGRPEFLVHVGGAYRSARAPAPLLAPGKWQHLAGVFDGREVRLYVGGRLVARGAAAGERARNDLPLYVGADPDEHGDPTSCFAGCVDEVRISRTARYAEESFAPPRSCAADGDTLLLLHLDERAGPWCLDSSGRGAHPTLVGCAGREPLVGSGRDG